MGRATTLRFPQVSENKQYASDEELARVDERLPWVETVIRRPKTGEGARLQASAQIHPVRCATFQKLLLSTEAPFVFYLPEQPLSVTR